MLWCPIGQSLVLTPRLLPTPLLSQTAAVNLTVSQGNLDEESMSR